MTFVTRVPWADLKAIAQGHVLSIRYLEDNEKYTLYLNSQAEAFTYQTIIEKETPASADQLDFENNFKADSNKKNTLDIDVVVDTQESLFEPKIENSLAAVAIPNGSDIELFSFSGKGQIQAAMFRFSNKSTQFVMQIDSIEIFRIQLGDMGAPGGYNMSDGSIGLPFPFFVANSDKQIYINFSGTPAGFQTNFKFFAQADTGGVSLLARFISFRELTTI